jgi:hypothetical protein
MIEIDDMNDCEDDDSIAVVVSKRKRPDVSERLKRRKTIDEKTVKMKLATICCNAELMKEINIVVEGVTRICVEASRFLNLYVLMKMEHGDSVPEMDQTFFYRAFTAIAGHSYAAIMEVFGDALVGYNALRPDSMQRFDTSLITSVISYAARDYMTACRNHVVLNIWNRVKKAFKLWLLALPQQFKAADSNKITMHFMKRLNLVAGPDDESAMWNSLTKKATLSTQQAVRLYLECNLQKYADLPLDVTGLHPVKRVEKQWWAYLRWCYDLQQFMETHGGRTFSILPLCAFAAKHIKISTCVLHDLLTRVARRTATADPEPLKAFEEHRRMHWESQFDLSQAEGNNKKKEFEFMLVTDGYAVSVLCSKPKLESSSSTSQSASAINLQGKRIVAVDPGRRDIVSCVSMDDESGDAITAHYSNAEYQVCYCLLCLFTAEH